MTENKVIPPGIEIPGFLAGIVIEKTEKDIVGQCFTV